MLSAPQPLPQDQPGPFAAIGNFIQRLQTSFNEGSDAIKQGPNSLFPTGEINSTTPTTTTTTTTTTTSTTTTVRPAFGFRPVPNPFDSINAILDNIGRSSSNNFDSGNNNIFGNVPGRNSPDTTPRPVFALTTTRPPFNLDGINQGINAFLQAFIKTNIDKLFNPGEQQQHSINARRSDELQQQRPPSFGDIINNLFKKQK